MGSAPSFTPPPVSSYQGPASSGDFTPPPISSYQGPASDGGSDKGFWSSLWEKANPLNVVSGMASAVGSPVKAVKSWTDQSQALKNAAESAYARGDYQEAAVHGANFLFNMVPGFGQAMDEAATAKTPEEFKSKLGAAMGTAIGAKEVKFAGDTTAAVLNKIPSAATSSSSSLYQSALKPGVADAPTLGDVRGTVQAGLDNSIPVSETGVGKLQRLLGEYGAKVKQVIDANKGQTVNPQDVAARVDDTRKTFASQVNPNKDLKDIDAAKQEFLNNQGATPGKPAGAPQKTGLLDANGNPIMRPGTPAVPANPGKLIPLDIAQALKTGTYKMLNDKYGEMGTAAIEAQKAIARGLKEEIESRVPEIAELNKGQEPLLDLQPALERAVRRLGNADIVKLGDEALSAGGGAIAGAPGAVSGFALSKIMGSPELKSKIAIALNKAAQRSGKPANMIAAGARAGALLSDIGAARDYQADSPLDTSRVSVPPVSPDVHRVGQSVNLRDIGPVTIKTMNPDGTFEY